MSEITIDWDKSDADVKIVCGKESWRITRSESSGKPQVIKE